MEAEDIMIYAMFQGAKVTTKSTLWTVKQILTVLQNLRDSPGLQNMKTFTKLDLNRSSVDLDQNIFGNFNGRQRLNHALKEFGINGVLNNGFDKDGQEVLKLSFYTKDSAALEDVLDKIKGEILNNEKNENNKKITKTKNKNQNTKTDQPRTDLEKNLNSQEEQLPHTREDFTIGLTSDELNQVVDLSTFTSFCSSANLGCQISNDQKTMTLNWHDPQKIPQQLNQVGQAVKKGVQGKVVDRRPLIERVDEAKVKATKINEKIRQPTQKLGRLKTTINEVR